MEWIFNFLSIFSIYEPNRYKEPVLHSLWCFFSESAYLKIHFLFCLDLLIMDFTAFLFERRIRVDAEKLIGAPTDYTLLHCTLYLRDVAFYSITNLNLILFHFRLFYFYFPKLYFPPLSQEVKILYTLLFSISEKQIALLTHQIGLLGDRCYFFSCF